MEDDIYARVLAKIPANTILQPLSHNGDWYKVSYQNQSGFVLAESVKVHPESEQYSSHGEEIVSPANNKPYNAPEADISIEEEFAQ